MTGSTEGHRGDNDLETELRTFNYNRIDLVLRVLGCRFSEHDLQLGSALASIKSEDNNVLDMKDTRLTYL